MPRFKSNENVYLLVFAEEENDKYNKDNDDNSDTYWCYDNDEIGLWFVVFDLARFYGKAKTI
jgi:hypothetical protein